MSVAKQMVLGLVLLAGTLALWLAYVPAASVWVERLGLDGVLGLEALEARETGDGPAGFGGGEATRVGVAEVVPGLLNDQITAVGDGRAIRSVTVRFEATGQIVALEVEPGARVERGAVLARLDDEAERIALERSELTLADAEEEVARLSQLQSAGAVTAVSIREAELALRTAELALREAEFDLAQRVVQAPITGTTGLLEVEVGDRVSAGDPLTVITDRREILIDFRVPERAIGAIDLGMPLEAKPLALAGTVLQGEISAIDNMVDRASRTLRVQGRLTNEGDRLRDGMAFSVTLMIPGETYPSIDPLSLQWSSEGSYVWAVRDGVAERVPVVIRQRNADAILVEAALAPGDLVVTEGLQTLRPGTEVQVVEAAASADPGQVERSL